MNDRTNEPNELSKKALDVLNEVAGCRYKTIKSATASEMLLAGEIIRLQQELAKASEGGNVVSFDTGDQLHELANNKFLRKYMMVCFWENEALSAGWGGVEALDHKDLAIGMRVLENKVDQEIFPKVKAERES